jgi:argininosuccinate synthase
MKLRHFLIIRTECGCMQGVGETDGLEAKAKASGASQLIIGDLKEEFVKDYIYPCLRAGAVYERKYLLGTSMARPIIAKVCHKGARKVSKIKPNLIS